MTHFVVGLGEVGKSLQQVLGCEGYDKPKEGDQLIGNYDVLHICFPYSDEFDHWVRYFQQAYQPKFTIVHSTVPVGTCKRLGVMHSPIRGKHPNLAGSIKTFVKYVSGIGCQVMVGELRRFGIEVIPVENTDNTEAGKLLDLMQYGMTILMNKEIHKFCEEHGLDFNIVYAHFNMTYNAGYWREGSAFFHRPILEYMPGKIGGHCVVQMMKLLDSPSARTIINENEKL